MKKLLLFILLIPQIVFSQVTLKDLLKNFTIDNDNGSSFMLYHKLHETEQAVVNCQITVYYKTNKRIELNLWCGNNQKLTNVDGFRQITFDLGGKKVRSPYVKDDVVEVGDLVFSNWGWVRFEQIIFDEKESLEIVKQICEYYLNNKSQHIFYNILNQDKRFQSCLGIREIQVLCDSWEIYNKMELIGINESINQIKNQN